MRMTQQVLSIEQMRHLKDLGVDTSGASMAWQSGVCMKDRDEWLLYAYGNCNLSYRYVEKTFTLQDILELFPKLIVQNNSFLDIRPNIIYSGLCVSYVDVNSHETIEVFRSDNLLDAAYETLCWLAENDYLNKK
ncbi:hypothetical protein [Bacteroides sp.]|uniref:hypothetical protein n=1 Tax=Bacteroides sp. TaxID=29523 RepID=UPI002621FF0C|nr:hypothetical protein [Bacteroides sp.]MDD3038839.1 hypothetical protein [Bacteroides sp.]